jgi:lipopolysaccharide/colanic/teichoic acid biosynthesis glycosyltransferase
VPGFLNTEDTELGTEGTENSIRASSLTPPFMYRRFGKRVCDLLAAMLAMVLLSPVLLVVSLLVWAKLGSPIFFRQERGGYRGSVFRVCKFRSMLDARDAAGNLLSDAERLTPFGRFLRASSLDELPELWHVVTGAMSLVGPRPLPAIYLPRYSAEQARRQDVLPGITGWAQVNGRNSISWEDKFRLDLWYVEHRSLWLDMKILLMTVGKVLRPSGISAAGDATMPEFFGTDCEGTAGASTINAATDSTDESRQPSAAR